MPTSLDAGLVNGQRLDGSWTRDAAAAINLTTSRTFDVPAATEAALLSTIADAQDAITTGLGGADIVLPPVEIALTATLDLTKFTGRFRGAGAGQSPSHSDPGHGSVIRWNGAAGSPMLRVRDGRHMIFEHFRLEGKDAAPPSFGLEFNNAGGGTGTNEYIAVRDVYIGKFLWSSQGSNVGAVDSGIGFTGTNANNDQFILDNVQIYYPNSYGLYIPNSQSLGGVARSLTVYQAGIAGISTQANIGLYSPQFYHNVLDVEIGGTSFARVLLHDPYSEDCDKFALVSNNGSLLMFGGTVQCDGVEASAAKVLFDLMPSNYQRLLIEGTRFTGMTTPANCRIEFGPENPGSVGRFFIEVRGAVGIVPDQLSLTGTFWASSPMSTGVVEWQSVNGDNLYQFRNELRTSGDGSRSTLSTSAWDLPLTQGQTVANRTAPNLGKEVNVSGSFALGTGYRSKADKYGQNAHASGYFAAVGDAQTSVLTLRRQVTNAAANTLLTDGVGARVTIADDTTWAFSVLVVARRSDADNESAAYKLEGCIDRNAGTVALVGAVTKTVLAEDTAAWDCNAAADDANKALSITFNGEVGKTIDVVARVELAEVTA